MSDLQTAPESESSAGEDPATIGVAISGGGHRATIWGLGALLYLVDAGRNRDVAAISSVSGGSIANGVVAHEIEYQAATPGDFRAAIRGLLRHVAHEGLFFFGESTNPYVRTILGMCALLAALTILLGGVAGTAIVALARPSAWPDTIGIGAFGVALTLVTATLAWKLNGVGTADRVKPDRPLIIGLAVAAAAGLGLAVAGAAGWGLSWSPRATAGVAALAWALTLVATLYLFELRSRVADAAMARIHYGGTTPTSLQDVERSTTHVFCATELQSADHAYLSPGFVYSYRHGTAEPWPDLRLSTAVQSSACLPGAFVPRRVDATDADWDRSYLAADDRIPSDAPRKLVLTDGGVYDNMADQWFQGLNRRLDRIPGLKARAHGPVDVLLVVNASGGWVWQPIKTTRLRSARELTGLLRAKSIMYDATTSHRRQGLIGRFQAAEATGRGMRGTLVHIPQSPFTVARAFENANDTDRAARAREVIEHLGEDTEREWERTARANTNVETVLRALGPVTTARLLRHAYVLAMCNAHVLFGWGLIPVPTRGSLRSLIEDRSEERDD